MTPNVRSSKSTCRIVFRMSADLVPRLSTRPRVLHAVYSLGRGGAETQLSYLASGLSAGGWDVHIALLGDIAGSEINERRVRDAGVTLHRLPPAGNHDPRHVLRLRALIRRVDPHVVQTWLTMMDVFGGLATLGDTRPWIMSERNAELSNVHSLKMGIRRLIARRASMVIANSEAGRAQWSDLARGGTPTRCVRNALPHDELAETKAIDRNSAGVPIADELIVYAGRLEAQKNIEGLLEALALVVAERNATALLFGKGDQDALVDRFVEERRLQDRIVRMGFTTELWSFIKAADVFVSVSHFEGMPNTVMEAMALGTPVVVSDTSPHREICSTEDALLVDRTNPPAIARAVTACLEETAATRARIAAASSRAATWSIAAAAEQYDALYRSLLPTTAFAETDLSS